MGQAVLSRRQAPRFELPRPDPYQILTIDHAFVSTIDGQAKDVVVRARYGGTLINLVGLGTLEF
jgi:hypothetical protein